MHAAPLQQNLERIRRLRGAPQEIVRQALESHRDFQATYGDLPAELAKLRQAGVRLGPDMFRQADYLTTTSGLVNRVFSSGSWAQLNILSPTFGLLPKVQLGGQVKLGFRAKTGYADSGKGGQTQGTIPTAITGSYTEVSPTPKETSTQYRASGLLQDIAAFDDVYGALQELHGELVVEHTKQIERALNTDVDTAAGVNKESVDRMCASSANQAAIGWDAGDEDFQGIDRSANTWWNAAQDRAATARALTTTLIDGRFRASLAAGGQPTVWHTGYSTWEAIATLYEAQGRFDIAVRDQRSAGKVNDADAAEGLAIATFVGRLHGRDIIVTDQAIADASELARLNLFDFSNPEGKNRPRCGMDIIRPTQVFMAGERSGSTPQDLGFAGDSLYAVTRGELGCRFAAVQAQLGDITSP